MKLTTKWALVTGGSRGIGRGICFELAKEGCNVVVNYVSHQEQAEETVQEIKTLGVESYSIKADVSNRDEVDNMVKAVTDKHELDILIGNAEYRITVNTIAAGAVITDINREQVEQFPG